jgi:CRISPR/Cas system type I-B associated protein Csh2 (Cas7 group RAMP superfamily)
MKERTKKEIDAEIKALEACKAYIPHHTTFGDNNHAHVDLQIEYLKGEIDTTSGEWDGYSNDQQSAILEAQYWKEGEEDKSPSSGWDNYKPKPAKKKK